jgi:hypothetical protein
VLEGFTITGGTGDTAGFGVQLGGGMFNDGAADTCFAAGIVGFRDQGIEGAVGWGYEARNPLSARQL